MDCAICWEEFENSAFSLFCGHIFHRACIERLASAGSHTISCPLCRQGGPSRIGGACVREIFFTSAQRAPAATTGATENQTQRELQQALKDNETAATNLARAREDNTVLANLSRDLQRKDAVQASQLQESKAREDTARKERDDAIAELATMKAEKAALSARVALLDEQRAEMERKIAQYAKIEESLSSTMALLRNIGGSNTETHGTASQTAPSTASSSSPEGSRPANASTSTTIPRVNVAPAPPIVYEEINVTSRHAGTAQRRDVLRIAPATTAPAVLTVPTPPAPKRRQLKTGSAILWTGYGCPERTAVLECVATDGRHRFSGKGTNQYKTRYTCTVRGCGVVVSE